MKITDDIQLDKSINELNNLLPVIIDTCESKETVRFRFEQLTNAIEEYETGTDVLNRDYKILPAKNVVGYLLYSPLTKGFFFRIYEEDRKTNFKDYKLSFEDMQIEIKDDFIKIYEKENGENRLDYSPNVLGYPDKEKS